MVGLDIRETVRTGEPATAEVIEFDTTERSEITYAYVTLRVRMADGREFVRERMSLPQTLIGDVRYAEELDVIVRPGRSEEHTSELQSRGHLVCRLLLEKKNKRHE